MANMDLWRFLELKQIDLNSRKEGINLFNKMLDIALINLEIAKEIAHQRGKSVAVIEDISKTIDKFEKYKKDNKKYESTILELFDIQINGSDDYINTLEFECELKEFLK